MFINCGFADEDERVRAEVLNAALEIIDVHGKSNVRIVLILLSSLGSGASRSCLRMPLADGSVLIPMHPIYMKVQSTV
jgi:hypothetical protein